MIDLDDEFEQRSRERNSRSGGLRHDVFISARVEAVEGGSVDAKIHDVSSTGMCLRLPMLKPGWVSCGLFPF